RNSQLFLPGALYHQQTRTRQNTRSGDAEERPGFAHSPLPYVPYVILVQRVATGAYLQLNFTEPTRSKIALRVIMQYIGDC
ncbi:MAG: hypothetical protein M3O61_17320, partial [Gemmatimonadota bacterium]|nr:hypothetical protein [Gemmatimonadota bacterium]